jgi:DNA-binding MurR/RpiR family transcriptional regulator
MMREFPPVLRDLLLDPNRALTPAEQKIQRILLADYPTSGLDSASGIARRAGVSNPTVTRFVMRLGFSGVAAFQAQLLTEVEARLRSPLEMMGATPAGSGNPVPDYFRSVTQAMERSAMVTPPQAYDHAARLVMEARGQVLLAGGRFSRHVAGMLAGYLMQFRPRVRETGPLSVAAFDRLIDLGKRDVVIVMDYRRYQLDVDRFATQAAGRGARIVLFTDSFRSPVARLAEVVLTADTEVASPYDSLTPAVAQIEVLVACVLASLSPAGRSRIEALEDIRHTNAVTLDSRSSPAPPGHDAEEPEP